MLAVWLVVGLSVNGALSCTVLDQAFCLSLCDSEAWGQPLVVVVGPDLDLNCATPSLKVSWMFWISWNWFMDMIRIYFCSLVDSTRGSDALLRATVFPGIYSDCEF
jgi:hypothetical protein